MNVYSIPTLAALIVTFSLGLFVYNKNRRSPVNITFSRWLFILTIWHFGSFFTYNVNNTEHALIASRITHAGAILIPPTFLHFILTFLGQQKQKKILILCAYTIAFLFEFLNLTPYFINSVSRLSFNYYGHGTFIYSFFVFFFFSVILYCHVILWSAVRKSTGIKRNQIKYLFVASLIGYTGGAVDFLPIFHIDVFPIGNPVNILFVCIVAYAIVKYRLMDIEVIIRRTLVFAGLVAFVFGVFSAATFLVREVLSAYLKMPGVWTYAISIFLIVLGYDPIRNLLVNTTDRFLFQKKYDYQKLLKDATKGISSIESLHHLLELVVHFITMKMRVKNAAVLSRINGSNEFKLGHERGYQKKYIEYSVSATSPLVQYLSREKEAIEMEHVNEYIESGNKKKVRGEEPHQYDFLTIKKQMVELGVVCCVPSFLGPELRNILVLGEKKSSDYYTDEDINLLFTLAQESAIAIENARLYDEAINKSRELEQINKQLEFAKARLLKALHDAEGANKQLQDTQAQLIHSRRWPPWVVSQLRLVMKSTIH